MNDRREYKRQWALANPDKVRAYNRTWYLRNAVKRASISRAWERANPAMAGALSRKYRLANPDKRAHLQSARRSRANGADGSHSMSEWRDKCALFANLCAYCGQAKKLTRDHKVPLTRGGTDDISNIVPSCGSCNSRKRTMTAAEFLAVGR